MAKRPTASPPARQKRKAYVHTDGLRVANSITTLPDERLHERRPTLVEDEADPEKGWTGDNADDVVLLAARKRFQTVVAAESTMRHEMFEDMRFRAGFQWPDQVLADRTNDKRPVITINRIPQFVKQITNPQRQSRPSIQVNPVGDGADVDTAEVIQGLIRHIEHLSHAEVAYDEAYEDAVVAGRGFFRILTEYAHDNTFEQEIVVKRVANPFAIYVDPSVQELDYSDARYMFVVEDIPKDEFDQTYGEDVANSLELFQSIGDRQPDWFPEGKVRIAEYFYVEEIERKIAMIRGANGEPLTIPFANVPKDTKVIRTRVVRDRKIHWVKMCAAHVLDHQIWPGKWIPIVPVLGDEIDLNGEKNLVGIVRYARDPQRMYNYWVSAETEMIALAPKAPFIGVEGQFKGHESEWKTANVKNHAYLEYVNVALNDKPAPPPQRQQFEPPIRAIVEATKQSDNDLKAVIGFYDASLGQPGPDQSGKAILARQKQGETANVNFIDNLGRALWHAGRIYLDLIPRVFDAPRVIHIIKPDDTSQTITINDDSILDGVKPSLDVRVGRYNITLSIGPSYQGKRQEAVASMLQLVQGAPQLIPIIGDLLVGEMDWPVAKQIAARLKKMLPPQLQDEGDTDKQIPPQVQAQMAQMQQQLQAMTQMYTKVVDLLKSKRLDVESRERIAMLSTQAQIAIAAMRYGSDADRKVLESEFERHTMAVDQLHQRMMQEDQNEHDLLMAVGDQQHQQATQQSQQGHDKEMAAAAAQQQQQQQQQAQAQQPAAGGSSAP